jgi:predicted phage terminase large subunit-like protein
VPSADVELDPRAEYAKLLLWKDASKLQRSLSDYIRDAWPIVEPATRYLDNWHIDCIAEHLMAVKDGDILNLIVNMPPRYGKSTPITVLFPTFVWATQPSERFVFTSYADTLAKTHSLARRSVLEHEWYQERWGDVVTLAADQNEKREFENTAKGRMIAVPVGGGITGKGGNWLIVDDPQNPEEADSDVERLNAINFLEGTLWSRIDDKKHGRRIIVMQRLHERDVTGHELAKGGWEHLCLPAIAERKTIIIFPKSGRKIVREAGDILWPEREGARELKLQEVAMTPLRFAGQYQQRPSQLVGNIVKRDWWKFYDELPAELDEVIDSCDSAFKDTDGSDYVTLFKWGRKAGNIYLLPDAIRARMNYPETKLAFKAMAQRQPIAFAKLMEEKANGVGIIQELQADIAGLLAVEPLGSKIARLSAASATIHAGNVWLPNPENPKYAHLRDVIMCIIEECANMPKGEHDDCADNVSQAVMYFVLQGGGIYAWLEQKVNEAEADKAKVIEQNQGHVFRYVSKEGVA